MNLLVDTQAFIYWTTRPEGLPTRALEAIRSRDNTVCLSIVSPWEMQIKFDLKKLELRDSPGTLVRNELNSGAFTLLPILVEHIEALALLPEHHRDPFDRLLIAQAMREELTIVPGDEIIATYHVATLWR